MCGGEVPGVREDVQSYAGLFNLGPKLAARGGTSGGTEEVSECEQGGVAGGLELGFHIGVGWCWLVLAGARRNRSGRGPRRSHRRAQE